MRPTFKYHNVFVPKGITNVDIHDMAALVVGGPASYRLPLTWQPCTATDVSIAVSGCLRLSITPGIHPLSA